MTNLINHLIIEPFWTSESKRKILVHCIRRPKCLFATLSVNEIFLLLAIEFCFSVHLHQVDMAHGCRKATPSMIHSRS